VTQPLRFDAVDRDSTRWQRADPQVAVLARAGWDQWTVYLPDGETAHLVQLHEEGDSYVGTCDCEAMEYDGICAHLCTIAKAAVVDHPDASGQPVEIASTADRFSGDVERTVADGGRRWRQ
jgi:hypothetical protein